MAGAKCKIKVDSMRVLDESNEGSSSDEPYVIVFVADVRKNALGITVPNAKTTMHRWGNADEGDLLHTVMEDEPLAAFVAPDQYCWGPDNGPAQIDNADQLVILAGIMENDDGSPTAARGMVNGLMAGSIANIAGANLTRDKLVKRLKDDMNSAMTQARITGAPDFDDRVGTVQELRLSAPDLTKVAKKQIVAKNLTFNGGDDDGAYRVRFELVPA